MAAWGSGAGLPSPQRVHPQCPKQLRAGRGVVAAALPAMQRVGRGCGARSVKAPRQVGWAPASGTGLGIKHSCTLGKEHLLVQASPGLEQGGKEQGQGVGSRDREARSRYKEVRSRDGEVRSRLREARSRAREARSRERCFSASVRQHPTPAVTETALHPC